MKLQKQVASKKAGKTYFKWVVLVPPNIVKALGWKKGTELDWCPDGLDGVYSVNPIRLILARRGKV